MSAPLPQPARTRWQPLRLGLVELYHYDVEEFWFEDGHLMLRGNNGTGKSKVLSLTLPFLLDASLSPARVEPDADPRKRMEWNLLMGGRSDRRSGYAWIEFGRVDEDGQAQFLTLGAGLRATAGRGSVDAWFFASEARIGEGLRLVDADRVVATRERLAEAIGSANVFTTAREYRRRVDERLFGLGEARYRALMDTLIQLRQPQLSKQPNEANLSRALTQALAPLERGVLEDVAEAMNRLDENRDELHELEAMQQALARFNQSHGRYAQILARRSAGVLRRAQTAVDNASSAAREAREQHTAAQTALERCQQHLAATETRQGEVASQIDVLQASPEMRSAHELQRSQTDAAAAERAARDAQADAAKARHRQADEQAHRARREEASAASRQRFAQTLQQAAEQAAGAGIAAAHQQSWGQAPEPDTLARLPAERQRQIGAAQTALAARRGDQIAQIGRALAAVDQATQAQHAAQHERDARQVESEAAAASLADAERTRQHAAQAHVAAWAGFAAHLVQALGTGRAADWPDAEEALADWVHSLDGASPLAARWRALAETERERHANQAAELRQQRQRIEAEREPLLAEQGRLQQGRQPTPPPPATRGADRSAQPGAPLWQLLDFADGVDAARRAGIEAALQASGLLDAWVTPEGALLDADTQDAWLVARSAEPHNLSEVLRFDARSNARDGAVVGTGTVHAILAAIALVDADAADGPAAAEAWIASDGRWRIGSVQGAWRKPSAEYIGFAAREAARQSRLQAIAEEIARLHERDAHLAAAEQALAAQREALRQLQLQLPRADALRSAHAGQAAAERRAATAREQLGEAEARLAQARQALERARGALTHDAEDLCLPAEREALAQVAQALAEYRLAIQAADSALREHARALAELATQAERTDVAHADAQQAAARAASARQQAEAACARHAELARSIGASVQEVMARLSAAQREHERLEHELRTARAREGAANKTLGGAEQAVQGTEQQLVDEQARRGAAAATFQAFAATDLLRAAVPALAIPDLAARWSNEAALNTARGAEAALREIDAGDEAWQRAQSRLGTEFSELQRAFSARGIDCHGDPGEHGFVVRVRFNQREEAPDALQALLEREVGERRRLLTARETEILENHLQAEIAAQLQGLMQAASRHVQAINAELAQHPTSTGVKFRLDWEPLPDDDGTPTRLAEVRRLLLDKTSDVWSPAERGAVGAFLQQRIEAERQQDAAAARIDQLASALDYRAWHRFRVRRWQDGQWKPLAGPASSGERALGLTVPLFAAAASHYESAAAFAPRLVLLDEAFAGIDDAARAHCMALIRAFDLDFVMTSEREWACYAELPGVSICHLVRRAGIDAVFVSRWRWNGRVREPAATPAALPQAPGDA